MVSLPCEQMKPDIVVLEALSLPSTLCQLSFVRSKLSEVKFKLNEPSHSIAKFSKFLEMDSTLLHTYIRLVHNSVAILFRVLVFRLLWVYLSIVVLYLKLNCSA